MKRREVIALDLPTCPGKVVYLAKKPQWDAAWYTDDINKAKVHRHPGIAVITILSHARVLSAWNISGYVDIPSAAVKKRHEREAHVRRMLGIQVQS